MTLPTDQLLQQGIAAHQEGKLEEAERLYREVLQSEPKNPDANHNLGVIALSSNQGSVALALFRTALDANPKVEQFWLSFIGALIKEREFENARKVIEQGKEQGVSVEKLDALEAMLSPSAQAQGSGIVSPSQHEIDTVMSHYQAGRHDDAEKLSQLMTEQFPEHPFGWSILGALYRQRGMKNEAVSASQKAVELAPQDPGAHIRARFRTRKIGCRACFRQAIALKAT